MKLIKIEAANSKMALRGGVLVSVNKDGIAEVEDQEVIALLRSAGWADYDGVAGSVKELLEEVVEEKTTEEVREPEEEVEEIEEVEEVEEVEEEEEILTPGPVPKKDRPKFNRRK